MKSSLNFYRDLIGLPVVAEVRIGDVDEAVVRRLEDGKMVWLVYRESFIKLVEMDTKPSVQTPSDLSIAIGYRSITLPTHDLEALMEQMEQAEVPIVVPSSNCLTASRSRWLKTLTAKLSGSLSRPRQRGRNIAPRQISESARPRVHPSAPARARPCSSRIRAWPSQVTQPVGESGLGLRDDSSDAMAGGCDWRQ